MPASTPSTRPTSTARGESEEIVGKALRGRRDDVFLATKFHGQIGANPLHAGNSRRWITRAVEDSLRRLDTDHLDLYQAHRPDPHTDLLETLQTLDGLVRQGKIRYYGTSVFPAQQLVEAHWLAEKHGLIAAAHRAAAVLAAGPRRRA